MTPVTTACPEGRRGKKTSYELSWEVKMAIKNIVQIPSCTERCVSIVVAGAANAAIP